MKKIRNYILIIFFALLFIQCSFKSNTYAISIENILSKEMTVPIINEICKKYNRDNLQEYIKLAKKFLSQTTSHDIKTADTGFIGYVVTTLVLSNDRIIETTFTMRNDGYKLRQQLAPTLKDMIKRGIIDNNYNEASDFFNDNFTKWAIPYIKDKCHFKF